MKQSEHIRVNLEFPNVTDDRLRYREDRVARFALKHFGRMSLEEVGMFMGVSRERVRQIERDAINKLRKLAKKGHPAAAECLLALRERMEQLEIESHWEKAELEAPGDDKLARRGVSFARQHTYQGRQWTMSELMAKYKLSYPTVKARLRDGIPMDAPKKSVGGRRKVAA
jgi:transcriptional regulator with XRE-family HTH domain